MGLQRTIEKTNHARQGIASLDDPAAELVLTRRCLDVAKVSYQLRCNGDRLDPALLTQFDTELRSAVETTLGGAVSDNAWVQATMAVPAAGLGLREASAVALPAFLARRAEQAGFVNLDQFRWHR